MMSHRGRLRYIRAIGSTCYNETGLTWPTTEQVDWDELLRGLKNPEPRWECEFGWGNQPPVLVFRATDDEVRVVDERIIEEALGYYLLVRDRDWRKVVTE